MTTDTLEDAVLQRLAETVLGLRGHTAEAGLFVTSEVAAHTNREAVVEVATDGPTFRVSIPWPQPLVTRL